ncbi:MAG: FHA domain-containing protein [Chloroflexota bacterium]|nr:FHA domain-containing protein [Chloroflexota bacterium]
MSNRLSRLILLCLALLIVYVSIGHVPANAQVIARAILSLPNTEAFPHITAYLNVYDGAGNFVHDLQAQDVNIVEDGHLIPVAELTELHNGAQFVVAINMGPVYAIKDNEGLTRYDRVKQSLSNWIGNYPSSATDDLSLLTNDGLSGLHYNNPVDWLSKLNTYEPNLDTSIPSLDVLTRAIEAASDPTTQDGMGRGVLLITPLPGQDSLAALPSLASMAKQGGVRVYIWVISSQAYFDSEGSTQLAEFAAKTGGQIFHFSGDENFPNIGNYVDQLRYFYKLSYESQITGGDTHQISARVNTPSLDIASDPIDYALSVQPPNPIFVSPPLQINRSSVTSENSLEDSTGYVPKQQLMEILIEFPDGFPRSLERTTLYVDGEIAAENSTPPFDSFSWDLSNYINTASHLIRVEAVDSLGLSSTSIEHKVEVTVQQPTQNVLSTIKQNRLIVAGISAAFIAGILIFVLVIRGKIQPKMTGNLSKQAHTKPKKQADAKESASVSQPIPQETKAQKKRLSQWMNRLSWPHHQETFDEDAYLEFDEDDEGEQRIPISQSELTFGSDPTLATVKLNDPSVDGLHARLRREENDDFYILDEGATAGTWVNYTPITSDGVKLKHGDVIHIGRIRSCFKLSDINKIPQPKITPQETL